MKCEGCGRELFLAYSCKATGFCPSCQAKRRAELAVFLNDEVIEPVPHRHVVLSLPRRLRPFFLYDRSLLCPMARCAWETLKEILQTAAGRDEGGAPGAVIGIHTCGDLLDWHPHVHVLISWGVFSREGAFRHVKAVPSKDTLEKLFRHKVLGQLRDRSLISEDAVANLLAWHHPGFGGYVSDRVGVGSPGGSTGLPEKLLGYLVRAPVALDRMTAAEDGSVIYRADSVHPRHRANFRAFRDPMEFIAALVPHIAGVHERNTLYYGFYSNRSRGERAKKVPRDKAPSPAASDRAPASVRKAWAVMIRRVYEADPLVCECGGRLRVIAFLDDLAIVQRILRHVGLLDDGLDEPKRAERTGPTRGGRRRDRRRARA